MNSEKRFRAVEVATTSLAIWWGIILLLPFNTFVISSSYSAMAGLATETAWGIIMLAQGVIQLTSMVFRFKKIKQFSYLVATFLWFFIAAMFAVGELSNTATGTYAIIGCLTGWLYLKVGDQNGR